MHHPHTLRCHWQATEQSAGQLIHIDALNKALKLLMQHLSNVTSVTVCRHILII
jgi:hypothetical protein